MGLRWAWISSQMDILCTSCFLVMTLLSKMAAHDGHMCLWLYVCVCLSVSVDCKFNCHKKCASQVPKNCLGEMKWSTSESLSLWLLLIEFSAAIGITYEFFCGLG